MQRTRIWVELLAKYRRELRRHVKTHEMPTGAGSSGAYAKPPVPTLVGTAKVTAVTCCAVKNRHARRLANLAIVAIDSRDLKRELHGRDNSFCLDLSSCLPHLIYARTPRCQREPLRGVASAF